MFTGTGAMFMEKKKSKIIVGRKNFYEYIAPLVIKLSEGEEEIEISAIGSNINKLEGLVRMITEISKSPIVEQGRRKEPVGNMEAVVCVLKRK